MLLDEILNNLKTEDKKNCYINEEKVYTYADMYKYVCNIYAYLIENNKTKKPIIVFGHKEIYMKASFLACSFAGFTYIPIDITMPKERILSIIKQVHPALLLGNFKNSLIKNIKTDELLNIMNNPNFNNINKIYLKESDIYYIIFTSGSTGIPKGVKVTYDNLNSCINWLKNDLKINNEIILNQAAFSFDLSVADLYLSLLNGNSQYILEKEIQNNFFELFKTLKQSNITLAVMTPSFADYLLLDRSFNKDLLPNLNKIIFCGEKLLKSTIKKLYSRFENIDIINSYGPTECTFAVTSIHINKNILEDNEIPIGIAKNDIDIYIVDNALNCLKENEIGEILISGKSVANGYVTKIKNNPFIEFKNKHSYLTGDIGYLKDNKLYYLNRKDKQVKYKGYRIELFDIEKNLYALNYIEKAVVLAKTKENNTVIKLYGFVKINNESNKTTTEIRKDLLKKLPEYMCPQIKIISNFPLTKNGKCDEKKLIGDC